MKLYRIGELASLGNVSIRTLRYYDEIGLLNPTLILENGYRQYSDDDYVKLQIIQFYKQCGFSLEMIIPVIKNNEYQSLFYKVQEQIAYLNVQIEQIKKTRDTLQSMQTILSKENPTLVDIQEATSILNESANVARHYHNASNLLTRIALHKDFSQNKTGWFPWVYGQIDFSKGYKIYEIGCGNGELWKNKGQNIRNREVFLSDISEGMLAQARQSLGDEFSYILSDASQIPFRSDYFDIIIANHVLFYVANIGETFEEVCRVLNSKGTFYCTTYGKHHLKEITEIAQGFDKRIKLSHLDLCSKFGIENGCDMLSEYFDSVEYHEYEDCLIIDKAQPIVDYILSCHGNQNEIIGKHLDAFYEYVNKCIEKSRYLKITKEAGIFICHGNKHNFYK